MIPPFLCVWHSCSRTTVCVRVCACAHEHSCVPLEIWILTSISSVSNAGGNWETVTFKEWASILHLFYQGGCSSYYCCAVCVLSHFSCVWLFETLWTVTHLAPLSIGFSRQEYWSGLPCPPSGIFLTQGLNACLLPLLHSQAGSLPLVQHRKQTTLKYSCTKQPFYYAPGFCSSEIQTRPNKDNFSLFHDVWGLTSEIWRLKVTLLFWDRIPWVFFMHISGSWWRLLG